MNEKVGFDGLVIFGLSSFSPFLICHLLHHPTVVTVTVPDVELVDGVGTVVSIDSIGPILFSLPVFMLDVETR